VIALSSDKNATKPVSKAKRLIKGPAYGFRPKTNKSKLSGWTHYRSDAQRSSYADSEISKDLKSLWEINVGGKLTPPTVADGKVFVSSISQHQVYAFDTKKGRMIWRFTPEGPVNGPPTYYKGICMFGSNDGWVYCLDADKGTLVWKFLAAPREQKILSYGNIESSWSIPGSILIDKNVAYFAAGRHSDIDEGIFVYAMDPFKGKIIWETQPAGKRGGLNDIFVKNDKGVYMWRWFFDGMQGNKISKDVIHTAKSMIAGSNLKKYHLIASNTLLDDTWNGRNLWRYKQARGQILCFNRQSGIYGINAYDMKSGNVIKLGKGNFHLFAQSGDKTSYDWDVELPIQAKSVSITKNMIITAGQLDRHDAENGMLCLYAVKDGKALKKLELSAAPVYDGLAIAEGQVFLSMQNGKLLCFGE